MRQEGNHVMLGFRLDGINARHIKNSIFAHLPDFLGGCLGHNAKRRHGICRMGLDFKPDPEARLRFPDGGHLGS
jgi:hypothetical protein